MPNTTTLTVAALGIPPDEQGVLRRLCSLTSSRARAYVLSADVTDSTPDIVLIDGDNESAVATWRDLCTSQPHYATLPAVIVSKAVLQPQAGRYTLQRPLLATRVIATLDQIAITAPTPQAAPRPRALVVDDSLPIRKQVELELQRLGIEVDCAESSEEAFAWLDKGTRYDLIFLDVILPGVDGYTLCKTIKRDRRHKQTPVIMLTGKGSLFDRARGKLVGCDTYLVKPAARASLEAVVHKHLSRPGA